MPDFKFITDKGQREQAENAHKLEVDELKVTLKAEGATAVEEATTGLKDKNVEILNEKKGLQKKLKLFDGIKPEDVATEHEFYEKNKDAEFLKDGTVEELIQQKTSQLTSDHETVVTELTENHDKQLVRGDLYQGLFEAKVMDDGLRAEAVKQGVLPGALQDILLRGKSVFSLDDNKQIEARTSDGKLATTADKKVLTPKNWIEGLKETSPHYWPGSTSANANANANFSDNDEITEQLAVLADKGDMKGYRALRAKQKKSKNK